MIRVTKEIAGQVETLMRKVAEEELLSRYKKLDPSEIVAKRDKSFVTIADEKSEEALIKGLLKILPEAMIVGEESFEKDPTILKHLEQGKLCWIIDPLDGTSNFASGEESRKNSGIIVSLVQGDEVRAGWILDIHRKTMTYAIAGQGAYHQGKRIKAKNSVRFDFNTAVAYPNAEYFIEHPEIVKDPQMGNKNFKAFADALIKHMQPANIRKVGCSAIEYTNIALGKALFGFHHFNTPWDHAAGQLIITEAGGYAGLMNGPYKPSLKCDKDMFIFCAHSKKIATRIQGIFHVMSLQWERKAREEKDVPKPVEEAPKPFVRFADKPEQLKLNLK